MQNFKALKHLLDSKNYLQITIQKYGDDQYAVQVSSKMLDHEKQPRFTPIIMRGKLEEIDAEFIKVIEQPITQTNEFYVDIESHAKVLEEERKALKEKKNKSDDKKTEIKKDTSKDDFEAKLSDARNLMVKKQYKEAIDILEKLHVENKSNKEIPGLIMQCKNNLTAPPLFDLDTPVEEPQQVVEPVQESAKENDDLDLTAL